MPCFKKLCMVFALSLPYPSVFFAAAFFKLEIASHHHDQLAHGGKQSIYHFKSLKGKTLPLHMNLLRQK